MMSSWRDQILREFTPKAARLTLAADPDGLLLEEGIVERIRERGFELIPFDDHIAFRYAYESRFRSRWDQGEPTDLVVVLRSQASDLGELPYDLLQAGRRLSFSLGDIFPNLSYPVVASLDRGDLDALYAAQQRHAPGRLGDNATKEFILRHVFQIAPELISKPSDLLRALLAATTAAGPSRRCSMIGSSSFCVRTAFLTTGSWPPSCQTGRPSLRLFRSAGRYFSTAWRRTITRL